MNKYYLPTYEECVNITKKYPPKTFYESKKLYDNYRFSFFNYRLAEYKHFLESNAFEMKGITFLHTKDKKYRYLMFNKFWELDQYSEFKYDNFKNKKIKKIMIKEDGNLVSFIKLPNSKIISRVKGGFKTIFNESANKFLYKNIKYYNFVEWCLDNEIIPLFEIVGKNRIVLEYKKDNLILLNLRNNINGEYIDIDNIDYNMDGINIVKTENLSFDDIIELSKTKKYFEGWVVQFEDDTLLKVKTKWYQEMKNYIIEKLKEEK